MDAEDELVFADVENVASTAHKPGWAKVNQARDQAQRDGLAWIWIDTCCIDKRSSAELSEAINSMFRWYGAATRCYVHLADLPANSIVATTDKRDAVTIQTLTGCRWFHRSWTLQEMIAPLPSSITFFDSVWTAVGSMLTLAKTVSQITGVSENVLSRGRHSTARLSIGACSVAQRLSWAATRKSSRKEDAAYSLFGLFDISLSIRYGEGDRAFVRLQEAIMRANPYDYSIFAWTRVHGSRSESRLLAPSPERFKDCRNMSTLEDKHTRPFMVVAHGVIMEVPILTVSKTMGHTVMAVLPCRKQDRHCAEAISLMLYKTSEDIADYDVQSLELIDSYLAFTEGVTTSITIRSETRMFRWRRFRAIISAMQEVKAFSAPVISQLFMRVKRDSRELLKLSQTRPASSWSTTELCFSLQADSVERPHALQPFEGHVDLKVKDHGSIKLTVRVIFDDHPLSKRKLVASSDVGGQGTVIYGLRRATMSLASDESSANATFDDTTGIEKRTDSCVRQITLVTPERTSQVGAEMRIVKFLDVNVLLVELGIFQTSPPETSNVAYHVKA